MPMLGTAVVASVVMSPVFELLMLGAAASVLLYYYLKS